MTGITVSEAEIESLPLIQRRRMLGYLVPAVNIPLFLYNVYQTYVHLQMGMLVGSQTFWEDIIVLATPEMAELASWIIALIAAGGLAAALAAPILVLYMVRLRRREVTISSTMLWQRLMQDRGWRFPEAGAGTAGHWRRREPGACRRQ